MLSCSAILETPPRCLGSKPPAKAPRKCLLPLFCVLDHLRSEGNSSIAWSAGPLLMLRSGGRRNSGCVCAGGSVGVSDSFPVPCSLAPQSGTFPSPPTLWPFLRSASAVVPLSGGEGSSVMSWLLSEGGEHVVSISHSGAKNTSLCLL